MGVGGEGVPEFVRGAWLQNASFPGDDTKRATKIARIDMVTADPVLLRVAAQFVRWEQPVPSERLRSPRAFNREAVRHLNPAAALFCVMCVQFLCLGDLMQ
jgi:hypothetical protein